MLLLIARYKKLTIVATVFCLLFSCLTQAQDANLTKEFAIRLDNDFFAGRGTDRYYTNGLFLSFSRTHASKNPSVLKKISTIEIGQEVYTPGRRNVYVVRELDRPITGYLYGKYALSYFKKNNLLLNAGASISTIGPSALGQQLLDAFHPFIQINAEYWDWMFNYQLRNEPGINLHGTLARGLVNKATWYQVTPVSQLTLGTSKSLFSQSLKLQFGQFNSMDQSALWNSRIGSTPRNKIELIGYYQPELLFQMYNATVQGGMFVTNKGRLVARPRRVLVHHTLGAMIANNRWTVGFSLTLQDREADIQLDRHAFGSLDLRYRFR